MKKFKPKFSPAPWIYPTDSTGAPDMAIFSVPKPKAARSEYGACVAHVMVADPITGFLSKAEYIANGHLISAAPSMYNVCDQLEEYAIAQVAEYNEDERSQVWVLLLEALKQARGL